jgi:nucleoside-diphosphate-sugar epimerase
MANEAYYHLAERSTVPGFRSMKRVLVTGATGFIGRHSLAVLLAAGYEVHAVTIEPPLSDSLGVLWHHADLLDDHQIQDLLDAVRPSHLLHFAWYATPGRYWIASENLQWVQASLALLQGFTRVGGQRVVMAGTCAEYDWNYGFCSEALTPPAPRMLYGVCKHAVQMMLTRFAQDNQISSAWGRIFFLYGPHERPERLVPTVIRSLLRNEPALCTHGNQVRDFLHVQDVASAFVALLDSSATGPVNIASGQAIRLKDMIYAIAAKTAQAPLVCLGAIPAPIDESPFLVADVRRLRDEVGWQPHFDLATGLDQTIDWWRQHLTL